MQTPPEVVAVPIFIASLTGWLTDKDYERMIGPWGGLFLSVVMLLILWRHTASRTKKDDESREKRHQESMELQRALGERLDRQNDKLTEIACESIKAQAKVAGAIERFDSNSQRLVLEFRELNDNLKGRPCWENRIPDMSRIPIMPTKE